MGDFLQDLRYGARSLRRAPGFSTIVVLTLALGVGATTAIFSVVYAVLLRPLPYPHSERLVWLGESSASARGISVTWINFQHWRDESRALERLAAFDQTHETWTGGLHGGDGEARLLRLGAVSGAFFDLLGAHALLGRLLTPEDDRPGAAPAIVLSHPFWTTAFGGDPGVLGQTMTLNDRAYRVVGVTSAGWRFFGRDVDGYVALGPRQAATLRRDAHGSMRAIGRLAPGATLDAARAEIDGIMRRLGADDPGAESEHRGELQIFAGRDAAEARPMLLTLMAAVGVMLLIACVNVANLIVARSGLRARELAIRAAIGAGRFRLARQLLAEHLLLAVLGAVAGLALAYWGLAALVHLAPPDIPRLAETRIDRHVLAFTGVLTIVTALALGLAPLATAGRTALVPALNDGSRSAAQPHRAQRLARVLVVAEIALTLVLAFACTLLVRSLIAAERRDPGFAPDHLLALEVVLPARYDNSDRRRDYFDRLAAEVRPLPGVTAAGETFCPPAAGDCLDWFYSLLDRPAPARDEVPISLFNAVGSSYFSTMRIPIRHGRAFADRDRAGAPAVAIVNETFARRWWETPAAAVGKRIKVGGPYLDGTTVEIVGVAGDVNQLGLDAPVAPEIYQPAAQTPRQAMVVMMRTANAPDALAPAVRAAVARLDPRVPVQGLRAFEQSLGATLARRRFGTALLTLFASVALALACVGIYGLLSGWVAMREGDIAIRMALGASRGTIARWTAAEALRLCAIGLAIGIVAGFVSARWLEGLLFAVSARNPMALVLAAVAVLAMAIAAAALPLWRATRVDAIRTLLHA